MPRHDWEQASSLRQPLRSRVPHVIEGKVPTAAERNSVSHVLIAVSVEQVRLIRRYRAVPLGKPWRVVQAMRQRVSQREISSTQIRRVRNLLRQARLQAVVVGFADVLEFRQAGEAAGRPWIDA